MTQQDIKRTLKGPGGTAHKSDSASHCLTPPLGWIQMDLEPHEKLGETKWWMSDGDPSLWRKDQFGSPGTSISPSPASCRLCDNVHRCAALNWALNKGLPGSTWKLRIFWCYSSPCHMKHPQSFQLCLTHHKKCIWKNQILVLLLLWCMKAYSRQKELYLCNSGTPNMISGIQKAMRKGDCVDGMYELFLSLLLMKSQGRGF